jgi:multidrug resistance efflux pump
MTPHCPDEQCKKRVEDMEIEMKAKQKISKYLWIFISLFVVAIAASLLNIWSNDRNMPNTYFTNAKAAETSIDVSNRIHSLEKNQATTDVDIRYIKDGIQVLVVSQKRMDEFLQKLDKKIK